MVRLVPGLEREKLQQDIDWLEQDVLLAGWLKVRNRLNYLADLRQRPVFLKSKQKEPAVLKQRVTR